MYCTSVYSIVLYKTQGHNGLGWRAKGCGCSTSYGTGWLEWDDTSPTSPLVMRCQMLIEITHLFERLDFNTDSESVREMVTLTLIVTFDVFGSRNERCFWREALRLHHLPQSIHNHNGLSQLQHRPGSAAQEDSSASEPQLQRQHPTSIIITMCRDDDDKPSVRSAICDKTQ
jgi:hypothetical protein